MFACVPSNSRSQRASLIFALLFPLSRSMASNFFQRWREFGQQCLQTTHRFQALRQSSQPEKAKRLRQAAEALKKPRRIRAPWHGQSKKLPKRKTTRSSYGRNRKKAKVRCYWRYASPKTTLFTAEGTTIPKKPNSAARQFFSKERFCCFFDSLRHGACARRGNGAV